MAANETPAVVAQTRILTAEQHRDLQAICKHRVAKGLGLDHDAWSGFEQ
jgi:hypothetical protein